MAAKPQIIIETDLFSDVDDAGAIALANILTSRGECELLGIGVNTPSKWGPLLAELLCASYGNPRVRIGALLPADESISDPDYARQTVETYGPNFGIAAARPTATLSAPKMHRELLAAAEDQSVTLVSIGFYRNLLGLLASEPDEVSALTGIELVRRKVNHAVVMGGTYPEGAEFNFQHDPAHTAQFVDAWPTAVTFVGFEAGVDVVTGRGLDAGEPGSSEPVALAYRLHSGAGQGRSSWDLIAVYLAVFGAADLFRLSDHGTVSVAPDGSNHWRRTPNGKHQYVVRAAANATIASAIDAYLHHSGQQEVR